MNAAVTVFFLILRVFSLYFLAVWPVQTAHAGACYQTPAVCGPDRGQKRGKLHRRADREPAGAALSPGAR